MKLSEWARRNGVHYQTAYRWFRSGALPVPARKLPTGTILVEVPPASDAAGGVAVYARVSAHDQRGDLDRQLGRLAAWAAGQGLAVTHTVAEVGSGLNGNRPKLRRLLADPAVTTIVVEHRDRPARVRGGPLPAGLAVRGKAWRRRRETLNAVALHRLLNRLKQTPRFAWLYEVSKCAPQEALRDLDRAVASFWQGRKQGRRVG